MGDVVDGIVITSSVGMLTLDVLFISQSEGQAVKQGTFSEPMPIAMVT